MPSNAIWSRTRVWLLFAVLTLALAGPAIPEVTAETDGPVTQADCVAAWNNASARLTCSATGLITLSSDQCRIQNDCDKREFVVSCGCWLVLSVVNDATFPLADVDDLHNCDGNLQVGAC